jgi:uncharacterized protein
VSTAGWPYIGLDAARLVAGGWRPTPFTEFVLKVAQRCNLACRYCFVYTKADQSWRTRPPQMPGAVLRSAAARIGEHVAAHGLEQITVVLHGGEPLLLGAARLAEMVGVVRAAVPATCVVHAVVQTNAVLLDEGSLDVLLAAGVRVGVSIDGDAATHDRHRPFHHGGGSHAAALSAVRLLAAPDRRAAFAGVLCTVDPHSDPVACYEQLSATCPPMIDFLLPHATWDEPPAGDGNAAYGRWLSRVFDVWCRGPGVVRVRLFDDILLQLVGGMGASEQVGLAPVAVVVVESDGAIEQVDSLKAAYEGAAATGRHVHTDPFDAVLHHPGVIARQIGVDALHAACRSCPVGRVCGGGHYVHRFDSRTGFRNPSVYCADLLYLIKHVRDRMPPQLLAAGRTAEHSPTGAGPCTA